MTSAHSHPVADVKHATRGLLSLALGASLALLLAAGIVHAGQDRPMEHLFNSADTDRNGLISEAEYHTAMQKRFAQMDTNRDGSLSREEMGKARDTAKQRLRELREAGQTPAK